MEFIKQNFDAIAFIGPSILFFTIGVVLFCISYYKKNTGLLDASKTAFYLAIPIISVFAIISIPVISIVAGFMYIVCELPNRFFEKIRKNYE